MKNLQHDKSCLCYHCEAKRNDRDFKWLLVAAILLALSASWFLTACTTTVTPPPVAAQQASYDQGEQNSGYLGAIPGGALITPRARDRYNGLAGIYGREFLPPLEKDHGITPHGDVFEITNEALQKFIVMNAWNKMGRQPKKS